MFLEQVLFFLNHKIINDKISIIFSVYSENLWNFAQYQNLFIEYIGTILKIINKLIIAK